MASRQRDFVNKVYTEARAAGLPDAQARLAASQAALETGYGKSVVGNNYFGIKASPSWTGPSVTTNTWEDIGGQRVNQPADFRAYDNPYQSFQDWAGVVGRNWADSLAAPTFDEAVNGLNYGQPGGYASDRNYGSKLRSINSMYGPDVQELGIANGVPTPTARPNTYNSLVGGNSYKPSNALLGYGPSDVQRASLTDPQDTGMFDSGRFAGPVTSPSPKTSVTAFDNERFGPANTQMSMADQYSAYGTGRAATEAAIQKSQQAFDNARFGPQVTTPTPSFDPGRFGPAPAPVAQGMEGLRKGLLDQQLNEGILPSIQYTAPLQQQTVTPGYVDPQVTTQQPVAATNSLLSNAAVQPPPQVQNGLLSQPEYNAVQAAGGFNPVNPNYALAAQVEKGMSNRRLGGGLLGGLAGGILLGPIGAIAGGLLGRNYAQKTYFPPAPAPSIDEQARKAAGLNKSYQGSGYNSLSGYGKSVYSGSGQFSSAVDSGKGGLW